MGVSKRIQPATERPLSVRRRKAENARRVNGQLQVEFVGEGLTSYAGLELLIRYFQRIRLNNLIRGCLKDAADWGDFGSVAMLRLLIGMLVVGGQRLRHVRFLEGDPLVHRFAGLRRLPSQRTISRWLKRFKIVTVARLQELNALIVAQSLSEMPLRTLSIGVDGSVLSTGLQVGRAFRGYNPHRRKVPSYYPISAHVGETTHILRVQNRSGNVHDGKASTSFLRDVFSQVECTLGKGYQLNFRMDAAFFLEPVIRLLEARGAGYGIKVPFWKWIGLKPLIQSRRRWRRIDAEVDFFEKHLPMEPWGMELRVVIYRKKVRHKAPRNYQLDLFDPVHGYYEYSAIATNMTLDGRRLWRFMCGQGELEKTLGQLKSGWALETIPTNHYQANSAWQQIVILAHNLLTNFQIDSGAARKARTQKRTAIYLLKSIRTLRFEVFNRAGQLIRPGGTTVLRLAKNPTVEAAFSRFSKPLAA